jgi:hypothetical protein
MEKIQGLAIKCNLLVIQLFFPPMRFSRARRTIDAMPAAETGGSMRASRFHFFWIAA